MLPHLLQRTVESSELTQTSRLLRHWQIIFIGNIGARNTEQYSCELCLAAYLLLNSIRVNSVVQQLTYATEPVLAK